MEYEDQVCKENRGQEKDGNATMTINEHILINAGRADVFAYVRDPMNRMEVIPLLERVDLEGDGTFGPGSRYTEIATIAGRRLETTYVVVAFRENEQISVATVKSVFPIRVDMQLQDAPGGTVIDIAIQLRLRGIFKIASPIIRSIVEGQTREVLNRIRQKMEER